MAEAAWEIYLEAEARTFLDTLSDAEKEELERLFALIEFTVDAGATTAFGWGLGKNRAGR